MKSYTTVPQIGWNSPHWFLRYGAHKLSGSLPAVTLTFDLLAPKANQHICEPKYVCGQNWMKFPSLFFEIWCSQVWKLIGTSMSPFASVTKTGWNSLYWFLWDMVFTRFSGHTDSDTQKRTHSQMDRPECSMPPSPFLNCDESITIPNPGTKMALIFAYFIVTRLNKA